LVLFFKKEQHFFCEQKKQKTLSVEGTRMTVTFSLNGSTVTVDAASTRLLLDVLRNDLALTGTRYGCGDEQCGACMVLIDGTPAYACGREVATVAGRSVTTVEGLGTPDRPSPLQQAFLAEQAGQCGYCLAGMQVAATALLARTPRPTRADIVAALDPHLCRCGAHPRILRAVERAAGL
jgi:nicotinate dehydrogenase subunit A